MDERFTNVVLNGEDFEIPGKLVENEAIFKNVLSYDTWQTLSSVERAHLQKFLPAISVNNPRLQDETVRLVFSEDPNFKHGNAKDILYKNIKAGRCSSSIVRRLRKCRHLKYKDYRLKEKQRCRRLLQGILVSRQRILDQLARHGPGQPIHTSRTEPTNISVSIDEKVHKKFQKVMKDLKTECQDDSISSDDEEFESQIYEQAAFHYHPHENQFAHRYSMPPGMPRIYPPPPGYQPYGFSPHKAPTGNSGDISEDTYRAMLERHRKRRICNEAHPELDVSITSLADIIMRSNPMKKVNKKSKKVKKIKKNRDEKLKAKKKHRSQLPPLSEKDILRIKQLSSKQPNSDRERYSQDDRTEEQQESSSENDDDLAEPCFFTLMRGFFLEREDFLCSSAELQQEIAAWETSDESADVPWAKDYPSWSSLVLSGLGYMAGQITTIPVPEFVHLVQFIPETNIWQWAGIGHDDDSILVSLCQHWFDFVKSQEDSCITQVEEPEPVLQSETQVIETTINQQKTDFVVRPSTDEEKVIFQIQERKRYENPHKPFIYKTHGFSSIVGPVKGVFNKDTGTSKAREHALLISSRPAYVTILSLVRDAVARLPNGEGTRAEVCQLLKDSAFINPEASDAQVHAVVSGALDRLHAEKDPCVKYDITRKLWVYLHRVRSVEEFERIHQASAAAAMAKKQMSQKQKVSSKKRSSQEPGDYVDDQITPKSKHAKSSSEKPKKSSKKSKASLISSPPTENRMSLDQSDVASTPSSSPIHSSFHSDYSTPKEEAPAMPGHYPEHLSYFAPVRGSHTSLNPNQGMGAVPLKITFPRGALGSFASSGMSLQIPKSAEHRVGIGSSQLETVGHLSSPEQIIMEQNAVEFLPQIDPSFEDSLQ